MEMPLMMQFLFKNRICSIRASSVPLYSYLNSLIVVNLKFNFHCHIMSPGVEYRMNISSLGVINLLSDDSRENNTQN